MTGREPITDRAAKEVEDLFRAEAPALFRRARVLTRGDRDAAEDLVQEVFEATVLGNWDTVCPLGDEDRRRWLFRVLMHKAVDRWRTEKRMVLDPFILDSELASQTMDGDPATLVLGSITVEQIWKEMKSMPPAQYRVAYLDWACGWTTREISGALGIAESTVRVHRHNAVQALRRLVVSLIDYDADEADDHEHGRGRRTVRPR
ncbi:MAG: RNA polymerase sigma factor [Pseudonocardiaceae bacterium]